MNLTNPLSKKPTLELIKEFIQESSLLNAMYIAQSLPASHV
jgi:KRAB domain-containing zinc finger protein